MASVPTHLGAGEFKELGCSPLLALICTRDVLQQSNVITANEDPVAEVRAADGLFLLLIGHHEPP